MYRRIFSDRACTPPRVLDIGLCVGRFSFFLFLKPPYLFISLSLSFSSSLKVTKKKERKKERKENKEKRQEEKLRFPGDPR